MHVIRAKRFLISLVATVVLALGIGAPSASAHPALVNVEIRNVLNNNKVNVQIPINAAANICGIEVNVLALDLGDNTATCTATSGRQELTITN